MSQLVHAHNPLETTKNASFDQALCTADTSTTTLSGNHSARLTSPIAETQRHPHHYAHATTRCMHLRPVRNAAASRAERNRTDPGTAHIRAIHTHATPMRATYLLTPMPIPFSLCHSPDLTDPRTLLTRYIYMYMYADPDVRTPTLLASYARAALLATLPSPPSGGDGGGTSPLPSPHGGRGAAKP